MLVGTTPLPVGLMAAIAYGEALDRVLSDERFAGERLDQARRDVWRWTPPPPCTTALYWFERYGGRMKYQKALEAERDAQAAHAKAADAVVRVRNGGRA